MLVWPVLFLWLCIGEGSFRCSLNTFFKGPRGFPYVFLITCKVPTLELVYGPTFVFHEVLVLGGNQEVFKCAITFEVGLYVIPTTDLLMLLHRP